MNKKNQVEKVTTAVGKVPPKRGTAPTRKRHCKNEGLSVADKFPHSKRSSGVASPQQSKSYQDAKLETAKK